MATPGVRMTTTETAMKGSSSTAAHSGSGGPRSSSLARATMGTMELRDVALEDMRLYVRLMTDPGMMAELGGPLAEDGLERKWREVVADVGNGSVWYFAIVPGGDTSEAAGSVCVWGREWNGEPINEM